MACFGAAARNTWAARGEHHEHPAHMQRPIRRRQAQTDVFEGRQGYRKASNWCPHARNDADDAHWKAQVAPRAPNDAGHGGGRGRDQAGRGARARMLMMLARAGRAGGGIRGRGEGGPARARACAPPPFPRSLPCPLPNE